MLQNNLVSLVLISIFLPKLALATLHVERAYFNHEKTVGVEFQSDQASDSLSISYINYMSVPPNEAAKKAVAALKGAISIWVDDTLHQGHELPLVVSPSSKHDFRIEIGKPSEAKKLSVVSYKPDSGFSANTTEISKFPVSFFRELSIVIEPIETIQRWLSRSQNQSDLDSLKPSMDLHTHFAGALRTDSILEIAENNRIPYPKKYLEELGINPSLLESADGDHVYISGKKLTPTDWLTLRNSMTLHTFQVATFPDMERKYRYRSPITKHLPSFKNFLWSLARDYQGFGVKYAELSISDIVKPEFLKIAQEELPKIEAETHVRLRFLVGMWRHMPGQVDNFNSFRKVVDLNCPEIVGIDIMGEETNSTKDNEIEKLIQKVNEYRRTQRSHFVIRVHAGESNVHSRNVEEAIEAGATRIGHGINGITEKVLQKALEHNVIIEINLNSNLALSNIQKLDEVITTLRAYVSKGVKLTLGTDGHGLYETSNASEFESVRYLGFLRDEFRRLKEVESEYLRTMQVGFERDVVVSSERSVSVSSRAIPTGDLWRLRSEAITRKQAEIREKLFSHGIRIIKEAELETYESQKTPVMVIAGGASRWLNLGPERQSLYTRWVTDLQRTLDPSKTFFISSGTELGVDAAIYSGVNMGLISPPLGLLPASTQTVFIAEPTDAALVLGENWGQRNDLVISFLNQRKGILIFLDTGETTKDLLVKAIDLNKETAAGGLSFFVYQPSESSIQKFVDRIEPSHLFSSFRELELGLQRFGVARASTLTVETFEGSERWGHFIPKVRPLPSYCRSEEIRTHASNLYQHYLSESFAESSVKKTGDEEAILQFISSTLGKNRVSPDPFKRISNQVVFFNEFREYANVFHQSVFSIDPRFLYYFFTQMNSSEILEFLRIKFEKGRDASQELAKLCIFLDLYAVENLSELPIPLEWPLQVKGVTMLDLREKSKEKEAELAGFKKGGFVSYNDVVLGLLPKPKEFEPSNSSKQFIIVRGGKQYNEAAISIKNALGKKGDNPVIFGTDAHRAESWIDYFSATQNSLEHAELRDQSRSKNKQVFDELLKLQYPTVIFATPGTNPKESFGSFVQAATRLGYQIKIITASFFVPPTKDYALKAGQRAFEEVESWTAERLEIGGVWVNQQPYEDFIKSFE